MLLLLPLLPGCSSSRSVGPPAAAGNGTPAPELVLRGVSVRHVADDGMRGRVEAERATYSLADKTLEAEVVTVRVPSERGEAEVDAPTAGWDTGKGVLLFPSGARATLGGEYRAVVGRGEVDLVSRLLRAEGEATLEGPGFSVSGSGLTWDFRAGTGSLSGPKARIAPSILEGRG